MATFSQLPCEIQQNILDRLVVDQTSLTDTDRKNLLGPLRVNSLWFHHIVSILWNSLSNLKSTFAHMDSRDDIRQFYASKIRILNFHTGRTNLQLIEKLKFESLVRLRLNGDHMGILPFLQPNLKAIFFYSNFALTRHELNQIPISCPNLRKIHILPDAIPNRSATIVKPNPDPIDPETFSAFFSSCKNLKSLTLGRSLPRPLVPAALTGMQPVVAAQLEELVFSDFEPRALLQDSCKSLETFISLRKFEIRYNHTGSYVPVATVLKSLATITSLEHLHLDHALVGHVIEECIKGHSAPFKNLQYLALKGDMLSISTFLSLSMRSLTRLQLVVEDRVHHICSSVSRLQHLTYLNLAIYINHRHASPPDAEKWQATPEDMYALSNLSRLRSISIRPYNKNINLLTAPWITDEYFGIWTSKSADLKDLELDIDWPVSWSSIVALSKSHPSLRTCKLLWIQEIANYHDLPSPEFADLQHLQLNLIILFDKSQIREFVKKFIKTPGIVSMQPPERQMGVEDRWQRPGLPRVTVVCAEAPTS